MSDITIRLSTKDELIPAVPPPGGAPPRSAPTTQIMAEVVQWPGNVFRLWAPEIIGTLWQNWEGGGFHQNFFPTSDGGLVWTHEGPGWSVDTHVHAKGHTLALTTRVTNLGDRDLPDVAVVNCVQFGLAPEFACSDFSRIYIRIAGDWSSLKSLEPKSDYPHYCSVSSAHDGNVGWGGDMSHLFEATKADHPLMVCLSKDVRRAVATASKDYEFLFHNKANPELWCIHSSQKPATVKPGGEALFEQSIYFVEGGIEECVHAFESDRTFPNTE